VKSRFLRRIPVVLGLTLLAGMAAWTAVTQTSFISDLVGTSTTTCTGTLAPGSYGNVVVPSGATCTINSSVTVIGYVQVNASATLHDTGATVRGDLTATTNSNVFISGSGGYSSTNAFFGGSVNVTGAHTVSITKTTINGSLSVQSSTASGSVSITNNNVGKNLSVTNNLGPTTVTGNKIGKNADCSGNAAFVGGGNTSGSHIDSCNA
jgi:hypothetical protein